MAKYLIEIDTSNDAFAADFEYELGRILRTAARKVENGGLDFKLRDSNGNTVGTAYLEEGSEEVDLESVDDEESDTPDEWYVDDKYGL